MAIDPYAPCPCGSGKKLKFCCADLAGDIEKVQQMVSGEQPRAALKHIEQLLEKHPTRASLLDLQLTLEISLHEFDAARQTCEDYLKAHPKSASAFAQAAVLASVTESGTKSIAPMQDALERLDGDEMPLRVLEAIGAVGQALLMEGELVAARGHLLMYAAIAPEENNRAIELLLRMNLQAGLPLLMREYLLLEECPDNVKWNDRFAEASRLSGRGLWRRAEAIFSELREEVGQEPAVVYNLALVRGWLGQSGRFAAGLHEYAKLDIPIDKAVEAEALAQLVDPGLEDPTLETVKITYAVNDLDALTEKFVSDKRIEDHALDPKEFGEDEVTRPRGTYLLLDQPTPSTGVDLARSEIPSVEAFLCLFGKRTDREARLELTTDRGKRCEQTLALLTEIVGDSLGEKIEEEVVAEKSISNESLSWRWRLPNDTPPDHRRKLLAEQRREAILDHWTNAPRAALGNKSPQEAVGDANLQLALMASALIIEQAAVDPAEQPLFAELRERLQLPMPEVLDPTGADLEHFPLVRIPRTDLSKLSDTEVAGLVDRAVLMGANVATLIVANELVSRPQLAEGVDAMPAYRQLVRLEPDHQQAFEWIAKAREWSKKNKKSVAEWVLMEMELVIERGEGKRLQTLLNEIRDNHINEPGIADATYRLLASAGLVDPNGPQGAATSGPQDAAAPPPSSGIWTPGDAAPAAESESEEKTAIWTP